ncbi:9931_t:CDS:2 [Paraglomus occultum]|uniref:9931_t:CDS:1 n=1 Tax=Paraglomus occultum TaxID=144539 RepID=A0A9N9AU91_9GLOM|nr:9931_t:CDS:2 [Paraglomus occultum]
MTTPLRPEQPYLLPNVSSGSPTPYHFDSSLYPTYAQYSRQATNEPSNHHIATTPPPTNSNIDETNMANANNATTVKRTSKTHVPSACINCKRAHLACDVSRPCKRCIALGRVDTCIDIKHKKRGRPKLKDKKPHPYNTHATRTWTNNPQIHHFLPPTTSNSISSPSSSVTSPPQLSQTSPPQSSPPQELPQRQTPHILPQQLQPSQQYPTCMSPPPQELSPLSPHHQRSPSYIKQQPPPPSSRYVTSYPQPIFTSSTYPQTPPSISPITENPPVIMFLTAADIWCARVSDESLAMLGYYSKELTHKPLLDYVHPSSQDSLRKMVMSLTDNAEKYYNHYHAQTYSPYPPSFREPPLTTQDPGFFALSLDELRYPAANGGYAIEVSDMISLRQRSGEYDLYNVKMHFGGGLGGDLSRKDTWNKLYIVAYFTKTRPGSNNGNTGRVAYGSRPNRALDIDQNRDYIHSQETPLSPQEYSSTSVGIQQSHPDMYQPHQVRSSLTSQPHIPRHEYKPNQQTHNHLAHIGNIQIPRSHNRHNTSRHASSAYSGYIDIGLMRSQERDSNKESGRMSVTSLLCKEVME